jgi:DNA-binding response OmpR family regulator
MRRARHTHQDLLIVVLTAHATVESAIAAVKLNAVDYMIKPCKLDDLSVTIARALAASAQQMRHQHLLSLVGEAMDALRQPKTADPAPAPPAAPPVPARALDLQVGVLRLDRQKRQATLEINPPHIVELTEGECSILVALMERPNQVLSYGDLAKTALGYDGMDKWTVESVIRSTVFRLRHKIEPGPSTPCLIRTVRGRGYFFSPT